MIIHEHRHKRIQDDYGIVHRHPSWIAMQVTVCTMLRPVQETTSYVEVESDCAPTCLLCIGYSNPWIHR